ncbi:HPF/RaiA family ribosome-associated protein [Methylotetracoccus oryzae]|uniref:HPF/RaiA family ribosome-associated protein n=1 Tax=Methylotetracoccus oryzae TaxID=1919059 RepID=UPI001F24C150|nr:HPF/RaiA family ribosome-associated protein [Methylotetracoccus oryzae]
MPARIALGREYFFITHRKFLKEVVGYTMQVPLEITFRGFPHSDAVETKVREKVAKLEQFCDHIISCKVAVSAEHHHQHQGNLYSVRIDLAVPQKHLVVSRDHHDKQAHEDLYVALRDAFEVAKRQLEEYVRMQRGDVKNHRSPPPAV